MGGRGLVDPLEMVLRIEQQDAVGRGVDGGEEGLQPPHLLGLGGGPGPQGTLDPLPDLPSSARQQRRVRFAHARGRPAQQALLPAPQARRHRDSDQRHRQTQQQRPDHWAAWLVRFGRARR